MDLVKLPGTVKFPVGATNAPEVREKLPLKERAEAKSPVSDTDALVLLIVKLFKPKVAPDAWLTFALSPPPRVTVPLLCVNVPDVTVKFPSTPSAAGELYVALFVLASLIVK